jgi:hypothetical protein
MDEREGKRKKRGLSEGEDQSRWRWWKENGAHPYTHTPTHAHHPLIRTSSSAGRRNVSSLAYPPPTCVSACSLASWLAGWLAGFAIKEIPGAFEGGESLGESPPRQARG